MNFSAPNVLLFFATAALVALALHALGYALRRMAGEGRGSTYKPKVLAAVGGYMVAVAVISAMAVGGFFSVAESVPPRGFVFFALILLCVAALALMRVGGGLRFLRYLPPSWLVFVQSYRIVIEIILVMLYGERLVPRELTWEGRNFDVLVGLGAPAVGYLLARRPGLGARRVAAVWNVFGLVSLLNILSVAVGSVPSPFRVYATNYLPTYFPGVLIPALVAPLAVYLHVLSLKQLARLRGGVGAAAV